MRVHVSIYILLCLDLHPHLILCIFSRSRLYTYDDVVEKVAQQLGLEDPSIIRLTPHNCYSQQPKPQPIKYRGVDHLSDMLVHYNQVIIDLSQLSSCFLFKKQNILFLSCMSDFGYIVRTWHPSARITRIENSESCISPCNQGWSEYIVIWFSFGFYLDYLPWHFFICLFRWLFIPSDSQSRALWEMSLMIWKQRSLCMSIILFINMPKLYIYSSLKSQLQPTCTHGFLYI